MVRADSECCWRIVWRRFRAQGAIMTLNALGRRGLLSNGFLDSGMTIHTGSWREWTLEGVGLKSRLP